MYLAQSSSDQFPKERSSSGYNNEALRKARARVHFQSELRDLRKRKAYLVKMSGLGRANTDDLAELDDLKKRITMNEEIIRIEDEFD